jgi:DNA-binding transcriptional ArsR family regulator
VDIEGEHGDELVAEPVDVEIVVLAMAVSSGVDLGVLHRIGTALADRTRRRIVQLLAGPAYPAEFADSFGTTRANLSKHLTCLRDCGLVTATAEGRRIRYDLADPRLGDALRLLSSLDLPGTCDT